MEGCNRTSWFAKTVMSRPLVELGKLAGESRRESGHPVLGGFGAHPRLKTRSDEKPVILAPLERARGPGRRDLPERGDGQPIVDDDARTAGIALGPDADDGDRAAV